ncbi:hypothetical protein MXD62_30195 [Frankia sp. Mgl5]|uniref:hypothetical protein n=1 Tax=Frankia sp. Mgl5 TaxID=2933793 RepID=UPI00200BAB96|nr:hypothetical protein [Frankia sp. Mgl5]MCK9931356.1 hypothetical protein [Frankia sp. Mgl5]
MRCGPAPTGSPNHYDTTFTAEEVEEMFLDDLDPAYTPPPGSPWDAVQIAAQSWLRYHHGTGRGTP